MTIAELAHQCNIPKDTAKKMVDAVEGVGFTEDQMIAIIECIVRLHEQPSTLTEK